MKKSILLIAAVICTATAPAGITEANQATSYSFTWKNLSPTTQCGYLEIKILNNGAVVNQKSSGTLLQYQVPLQMNLNANSCTKIQLKAICSGHSNFQEIGCIGGTIEITSSDSMTFYR